jgi:5-methylcytosine-specific restriction endonuclease McrA
MRRKFGTDLFGDDFNDYKKKVVWEKAEIIPTENKDQKRKDRCGAIIHWDKYGDTTDTGFGWEIDHIKPVVLGGTDELTNLQALQWQNNRQKSDVYPGLKYCKISAGSR